MKTIRSFTVMLPDGDLYGFPKKFVPAINGDFYQWLLKNGYPIHMIKRTTMVKMTDIEYYDDEAVGGMYGAERIV